MKLVVRVFLPLSCRPLRCLHERLLATCQDLARKEGGTAQRLLSSALQCEAGHHPCAGYGILGPYARGQGWAPGPIMDWKDGATGWILWISLAIMLGDSLTSLSILIINSAASCSKCAGLPPCSPFSKRFHASGTPPNPTRQPLDFAACLQ